MMDAAALDARLAFATRLAGEMGRQALARQAARSGPTSFKGHQDYVTEVDGDIERQIAAAVAREFPSDDFFGEEGGGGAGRSLWVVDPIDGTANFARGGHYWCVSIAHMTDGVADIGVVAAPALGRVYAARLGGGATCDGRALRVSTTARPSEAVIEIDWTPSLPRPAYLASLDRAIAAGLEFRRSGACALSMALVAQGAIDGFAECFTKPWDALAGCVLVREAGGIASPFEKGLLANGGNPIVAAGPALYDVLAGATGYLDAPR
jgi:myo-inositol-1(or 4)-monophosphatase